MGPFIHGLVAPASAFAQEFAVAALEEQKDRLKSYNPQARFAVAQLYDRAPTATEGTHAAAPQ